MSDNTLWGVYVQRDDEWHAMASREAADAYVASLGGYVAPWPFDAEEHAAELTEKAAR